MPDYNLYGLSSRSFEHLVQAIATRVIGSGTVVFGDGPDGAREATFEGKSQFPSSTEPWDGYIVIQAKFHQRFQSVEADGKWAITALSKELRKFSSRKRALRSPEYYIFCTNVVLTPTERTGTKDRAQELLRDFARRRGLKSYAIWDSDQIRTFLEFMPEVRQTYAAWITSGDVLARLIRSLEWRRPNFELVMTGFLQRELLADQYVNLEQAGHAAEEKTPMARVFIDVPVSSQPTSDPLDETEKDLLTGFVREFIAEGAHRLSPDCQNSANGKLKDVKPVAGRFVLVGGPGQGKTTVSQFVCQLHRAALLNECPRSLLAPEVQTALELIQAQCTSDATELPTCRRFPFRITLNHLARELSSPTGAKSVLSYIAARIKSRTSYDVDNDDLRQWLAEYPWMLVFDGLDEVPPASNRDDVLTIIQEFWIDATQLQADILVLATTRPQGYEQDFSPQFYTHRYLTPLSAVRAMNYGRRLAAARYGSDKEREQRIVGRLERAASEDSTARLMRSPLQVTIMATLVDQAGQPPRERWRLFREYYEVIYRREMERDIPAANILREYKSNIDYIHHQVGLILQIESEKAGQTDARLPALAFGTIVDARLKAEGYETKSLGNLKRQIIEAATHRLVFLVGMQADQVGFEIRSLQEFMAAEALTEQEDGIVANRLNAIASLAHWQNVFLFAAGKCFAARQHLRDTVLSICTTLNEGEKDDVGPRVFLGSQLALDLLVDGTAHQQPKFERSLARLALKLSDRSDLAFQQQLVYAYQSSLEEVYRDELRMRLDGSRTSNQLGAWMALLGLIERGVKWALILGSERWPENPEEQLQILENFFGQFDVYPEIHIKAQWLVDKIVNFTKRTAFVSAIRAGLLWMGRSKGAPDWFCALSKIVGYPFRVSDVEIPFQGCSLRILPIRIKAAAKLWTAVSAMPDGPKDWMLIKQLAKFAVDPDAIGLARTLENLAEIWSPELANILSRISPWPLAESILCCWCEDDVRKMAALSRTGKLGNSESWSQAESRWVRGVTLDDLIVSDLNGGIPGAYLVEAGFAFLSASVFRYQEPFNGQRLLELYRGLKTQPLKVALSRLILRLTAYVEHPLNLPKTSFWISIPDLAELFQSCEGEHLPLRAIVSILRSCPDDQIDLKSIDALCRNARLFEHRGIVASTIHEVISRAWAQDPALKGLLVFLAVWAADTDGYEFMNEPLGTYSDPDARYVAASLILKLVHTRASAVSARTIAATLADNLQDIKFDAISAAVRASGNKHVDRVVAAAFLLELYERLPTCDVGSRNRVLAGLDEMVRRRQSELDEPSNQVKLKLGIVVPDGVRRV
jgi:hypothetical protein